MLTRSAGLPGWRPRPAVICSRFLIVPLLWLTLAAPVEAALPDSVAVAPMGGDLASLATVDVVPTPPLAARPSGPEWSDTKDEGAHHLGLEARYQRVDGVYLGFRYAYRHPDRPLPRFRAEVGDATVRKRWLYSFEMEQPLLPRERLRLGAGLHRLTRSFEFDDEIVGTAENTLAALLLKQDYGEYFEAEGGRFFGTLDLTDKFSLGASYRLEEQRPLRSMAKWSLFDGDRFRPNPRAGAGDLRSLAVTLGHDSRPKKEDDGIPFIHEMRRANRDWVRLTYVTAGRSLGGDFDYAAVRLDARGYWKLSPEQFLSARLLAGRQVRGRLPLQEQFYAGGISTLRGHAYKEFRGDRLLLLNAEYAVDVYRAMQVVVFTDAGRAWFDAQAPNGPRMAVDAGFGFQTRDERVRIFLAKDVRDASSPLFMTIRTQASF